MTAEPYLPENVAEIGSVHVSIGLGKEGTGASFATEGLSDEAAVGYLVAVTDQLRERVKKRYDSANEASEFAGLQLDCPHCHEHIEIYFEDEQ